MISDPCFYTYQSLFGDAEVFELETDDGRPLRALYVDGGFQSASYLDEQRMQAPFAYLRAMAELASQAVNALQCEGTDAADLHANMLLLGGGTYSLPKHLLMEMKCPANLDVVEIDPVVAHVARCHFFLDEVEEIHGAAGTGRLNTYIQDGCDFVAACEDASYDVIMNDCFAGTVQDGNLLCVEALQDAKRCLRAGGIYLLNAVAEDEDGNDDLAEIAAVQTRLEEVFPQVKHIAVEDDELFGSVNHFFVGRMDS